VNVNVPVSTVRMVAVLIVARKANLVAQSVAAVRKKSRA